MNKRTSRLLLDSLLAVILALGISYLVDASQEFLPVQPLVLSVLPLIWLALRYGLASGVMAGALTGLVVMLLNRPSDWLAAFLESLLPYLSVGLAGLFAKYTQKTLNNKRYSSTYLNIWTGSLLTLLAYYLLAYWLVPMALGQESLAPITTLNFWIGALVTWVVTGLILSLIARLQPSWLIPRRTRFLSRKETSSLLND